MLIAEDLLLLLLDDESGAAQTSWMRPALGGALLVELALGEQVVPEKRGRLRADRIVVGPGAVPPSDPLLAAAFDAVGEKGRSAQDLVNRLGKDQQQALTQRLVERGILEQRDTRVLGIFPRHRWPAKDTTHEDQVRRALQAALVDGAQPDERTAALVALLAALKRAHRTIDRRGLSSRDVRRRATEIADGDWAAKGVRDAIQAAIAATSAATAAAGASAAATGAS